MEEEERRNSYRPMSSQTGVEPSNANNKFVFNKFFARATSMSVQAVAMRHLNESERVRRIFFHRLALPFVLQSTHRVVDTHAIGD